MIKYLCPLFFTFIGAFSIFTNDLLLLKITVYAIWISNILYACTNIKKHIVFFMFHITFFTFLLGNTTASSLAINQDLRTDVISLFSFKTQIHIYTTLFISLVTLFFSYSFFSSRNDNYLVSEININSPRIIAYRRYAKILSYVFFIFALIVNLEKTSFVLSSSYIDYYIDYKTNLPSIVGKLANFYNFSFYLFLTTMPTKKECRIPIFLFLLLGLSSLGYGQRNALMLNISMIVIYYTLRDNINIYGDERWITKKKIIIALITLPFLLSLLNAFSFIRSNQDYSFTSSLWDSFVGFFHNQGKTVRLIGHEKDLHYKFPLDFPYSLGYFVDRFTNIEFIKPFNMFPSYEPKSYQLAVYGHNFGETITFLVDPARYYSGGGLGSCYIAEMYHDFGFFGIIFINILYSFIFSKVNLLTGYNIWGVFCIMIILERVLYSPRADALGCFTEFLSSAFIVFIILMYYIGHNYPNPPLALEDDTEDYQQK